MVITQGTVPFPPNADPQALTAFGTSCSQLATALRGAAVQVQTATTAAGNAWSGQASTAFVGHMTTRAQAITANAAVLARVAPVMTAYAQELTACEQAYSLAVAAQQAALVALPFSAPVEAAAVAAEEAAVLALEAVGLICAAQLAAVMAELGMGELSTFVPELEQAISRELDSLRISATGLAEHAVGDDVTLLALALGRFMPDGPGYATPVYPDKKMVAPPTTLGGMLDTLNYVQKMDLDSHGNKLPVGSIAIQHVSGDNYVVYLPGVQSFNPFGDNPQNLWGAGRQVATGSSAFEASVKMAIAEAHIPPGANLMFVTHSQGQLTAVDLANDADFTKIYNVTNIFGAAGPTGSLDVPAATKMLSMKDTADLVPNLDDIIPSQQNPTYTFWDQPGGTLGVMANHSLEDVYAAQAKTPGFTSNGAVEAFTDNAKVYLTGKGDLQLFQIATNPPNPIRVPPPLAPPAMVPAPAVPSPDPVPVGR